MSTPQFGQHPCLPRGVCETVIAIRQPRQSIRCHRQKQPRQECGPQQFEAMVGVLAHDCPSQKIAMISLISRCQE